MSQREKWIIVIEKDFGEYVAHGWWETGSKIIHPYEYDSQADAMKAALELPKDVGNCKILLKHEQDGGAE